MPSKRTPLHEPYARTDSDLHQPVIDLGWALARRTSAEDVRVGDRLLPRSVTIERKPVADEPGVEIDLAVVDGIPTCVRAAISSTASRGVLQVDLLSLNLTEIISDVFAAFSMTVIGGSENGPFWVVADASAGKDDRRAAKKLINSKRRRKITPELLQQVAQVYKDNFDDNPTDAVRRVFGVETRMASQYVRKARDAGYLGQAQPGRKSL